MAVGFGLAGVGTAVVHAQPAPIPDYHWCPGEWWDPGWGQNWDGGNCHDDHHRDRDGWDHSRDWNGPPGDHDHDRGDPWQPQPWQPQPWQR